MSNCIKKDIVQHFHSVQHYKYTNLRRNLKQFKDINQVMWHPALPVPCVPWLIYMQSVYCITLTNVAVHSYKKLLLSACLHAINPIEQHLIHMYPVQEPVFPWRLPFVCTYIMCVLCVCVYSLPAEAIENRQYT